MQFSVIIPLYNKEAHIEEAIHSVLSQSFTEFELIVVDDSSTDGSLKKAQNFSDKRVKVYTKKNGGTASARNFGISKSQGEYLCFLDADDFWERHFLENIDHLINSFPEAGMYCTSYQFLKKRKLYHPGYHGFPEAQPHFLVPDYFESVLYGEQVATASSVSIPNRIFDELGTFNETIRHTEDQEMWNRIAMKYPLAFHTKSAAVYRQDAQSMKTKRVPKQEIEYASCLQNQLDENEIPKEKIKVAQKIIAANLIGVASLNLLAGDKKTAKKFLNDPRSNYFPERKAAWQKLMPFPSFIVRILYKLRNKTQNRR